MFQKANHKMYSYWVGIILVHRALRPRVTAKGPGIDRFGCVHFQIFLYNCIALFLN